MASIIISFVDTSGTNSYQFDISDAAMDRIITAGRTLYPNPDGTPNSKNGARRLMSRTVVSGWKESARSFEGVAAASAIPPIDTTEV